MGLRSTPKSALCLPSFKRRPLGMRDTRAKAKGRDTALALLLLPCWGESTRLQRATRARTPLGAPPSSAGRPGSFSFVSRPLFPCVVVSLCVLGSLSRETHGSVWHGKDPIGAGAPVDGCIFVSHCRTALDKASTSRVHTWLSVTAACFRRMQDQHSTRQKHYGGMYVRA